MRNRKKPKKPEPIDSYYLDALARKKRMMQIDMIGIRPKDEPDHIKDFLEREATQDKMEESKEWKILEEKLKIKSVRKFKGWL